MGTVTIAGDVSVNEFGGYSGASGHVLVAATGTTGPAAGAWNVLTAPWVSALNGNDAELSFP